MSSPSLVLFAAWSAAAVAAAAADAAGARHGAVAARSPGVGLRRDPAGAPECAALTRADTAAPDAAAAVRATADLHNGVVRWDVARGPIRLWVQRRPASETDARRPRAEWEAAVREAAAGWRGLAPGLEFRAAPDSAAADVVVTWHRALPDPTASGWLASASAGRTTVVPDADGRAAAAHVRLAIASPAGVPYSLQDARAVATHELGHAIGLAHHDSPRSVMAPLVAVDRPADADRDAVRLLYALPIGARCPGPAPLARR